MPDRLQDDVFSRGSQVTVTTPTEASLASGGSPSLLALTSNDSSTGMMYHGTSSPSIAPSRRTSFSNTYPSNSPPFPEPQHSLRHVNRMDSQSVMSTYDLPTSVTSDQDTEST